MFLRYRCTFRLLALFLVFMFLAGCAGVAEKWENLTPAEQSRVVLSGMQDQLNNLFDTGKAFIALHPEKAETWKTKIVPAFSAANHAIASAVTLCMTENVTPNDVYKAVQPLITEVINLLAEIGVLKGVM